MEVPGLIPGTDLRPADVLTSALGNAYTALDVSICSPHALEAGTDCTQSSMEAKLEHYGPHLATLLRQNISYTPIVWSAYGRPHPDTLTVLRSRSKSIARKRNIASAEVVFHLAPNGSSFPRPGSLVFASRVVAPVLPRAPWFLSAPLALSVLAFLRICLGRPWRLATLAPQGLGPGVPCLTAPVAIFVCAVSPSFVGAPLPRLLWLHVSR